MKNHTVYFEIFGKKMRTNILAESENDAKLKIQNKIIFHKIVVPADDEFNQIVDFFDSFIDSLKGKK